MSGGSPFDPVTPQAVAISHLFLLTLLLLGGSRGGAGLRRRGQDMEVEARVVEEARLLRHLQMPRGRTYRR